MPKKKLKKYEDFHLEIIAEIEKRRPKWQLSSLAWMDFGDVTQIISAHIALKWSQWDQVRPLIPWVNKIVTNQFKNILRNNYSNFVRPCLSCPFNLSESNGSGNACSFTPSKLQDNSCPLFAKWEKTKKSAYDIKMAVPIETKEYEIKKITSDINDIDIATKRLHVEIEKQLNPRHYKVYKMLFIDFKSEEEVAKEMGYKTTEKGRSAGYKQIKNLKKQFKDLAKKILKNKDIFYNEKD